ncbi:MAG TPA: hypothetical protein VF173_32055 [Thermoanaerobaculia bacterium]|nr:hypothetical protein [Thermoanaerobaculia bacterium]
MKKTTLIPKLVLAAALVAGAMALPSQAISSGSGCPHHGFCPDIYQPVICSNGVVYSNSCFASLACATGCVPYGLD